MQGSSLVENARIRRDCIRIAKDFFPSSYLAVLTGSAVRYPSAPANLVADLDVVILDESAPFEGDEVSVRYVGRRIEIERYSRARIRSICADSQSVFWLYREIKKLQYGSLLFEESPCWEDVKLEIAGASFDDRWLTRLLAQAAAFSVHGVPSRLQFFNAVECLLIASYYLCDSWGPSKPKWYALDAEIRFDRPIFTLLCAIEREFLESSTLAETFLMLQNASKGLTDVPRRVLVNRLARDGIVWMEGAKSLPASVTAFCAATRLVKGVLMQRGAATADHGCWWDGYRALISTEAGLRIVEESFRFSAPTTGDLLEKWCQAVGSVQQRLGARMTNGNRGQSLAPLEHRQSATGYQT